MRRKKPSYRNFYVKPASLSFKDLVFYLFEVVFLFTKIHGRYQCRGYPAYEARQTYTPVRFINIDEITIFVAEFHSTIFVLGIQINLLCSRLTK